MKSYTVLAALLLLTPGGAQACTQQDAMAKGIKLSQIVQAKMAQAPAQGQALMTKLQSIMMANQGQIAIGGTIDWAKVCGQYDAFIEQTQ